VDRHPIHVQSRDCNKKILHKGTLKTLVPPTSIILCRANVGRLSPNAIAVTRNCGRKTPQQRSSSVCRYSRFHAISVVFLLILVSLSPSPVSSRSIPQKGFAPQNTKRDSKKAASRSVRKDPVGISLFCSSSILPSFHISEGASDAKEKVPGLNAGLIGSRDCP